MPEEPDGFAVDGDADAVGTEHVSFIQGTTVRALARDGGAYIGMFDTGHYVTTVVDLSTGATVATVQDESPAGWLSDNRLLVSPNIESEGPTCSRRPSTLPPRCRQISRRARCRRGSTRSRRDSAWAVMPVREREAAAR